MNKKPAGRWCKLLRRTIFLILLFLLCVYVLVWYLATSKPKNESELYGTYISFYKVSLCDVLKEGGVSEPIGIAKEKLILKNDGTFMQKVALKATSKVDIAEGTWEYDPKLGYVIFGGNFMSVLDGYGKLNPNYDKRGLANAHLPANKYFGCILIGTAEGVMYRKIK